MPYVIKPHWDGDGLVTEGVAGEALSKYDLVYLKGGKWYKADLDTEATLPARGMATSNQPINYKCIILHYGLIRNPAWTWVDGPIYASSTPGGLTQTAPTVSGWVQSVGDAHGSDFMLFGSHWIKELGVTRTVHRHLSTGLLGKPGVGAAPEIVIQDNAKLLAFTVNTDSFFYEWTIPTNYAGGGLEVAIHWTNDGDTDDLNKNIKFELSYQVYSIGGSIAGSHANSPKVVDDAYTSGAGWVPHTAPSMTIAHADIVGQHAVHLKGMFITADATVLSCEPHLISISKTFEAYVEL